MSGDPWPDLEQKIASGEVKGSWPAARDHWGAWGSKLETVFLVAVPAEANRNPARILPGREDVYIIPRADCTPGFEGDSNVYFSPKNIMACLVLKPPSNAAEMEPQLASLTRVQCSTQYDKKGMHNLQLSPISDDAKVIDIDEGKQFSPKITQFTMSIAQSVNAASVVKELHHSPLQPTFSSQQLWLEDIARFRPAEMEAGIVGVEQLLTQAYSMVYYFTTIEKAIAICRDGIPTVSDCDSGTQSLTVCLLPPSAMELRWQTNAGGGFKQRVADLLGMDPNHVQAMVLLGIPSTAIELAECVGEPTFTLTESVDNLTLLQQPTEEDGAVNVVYSKAHIAKVWTLEATALSDARQALVNMQEDEGKDVSDLERKIQELLAGETASAVVDEGVPPGVEELKQAMVEVRRAAEETQRAADEKLAALQAQLAAVTK